HVTPGRRPRVSGVSMDVSRVATRGYPRPSVRWISGQQSAAQPLWHVALLAITKAGFQAQAHRTHDRSPQYPLDADVIEGFGGSDRVRQTSRSTADFLWAHAPRNQRGARRNQLLQLWGMGRLAAHVPDDR